MPDESLLPMPTEWQRGLGIVAHPDDLEYGAAGAVAAWTSEGREFAYLLVTRGEVGIDGIAPERAGPLREAEQRAGAAEVGVRWVAVAGSPHGTHAVDVSAQLDRAVASLAAHRAYLAALGDEPPEQQARTFLEQMVEGEGERFSGRPAVSFELISR